MDGVFAQHRISTDFPDGERWANAPYVKVLTERSGVGFLPKREEKGSEALFCFPLPRT